MWEGKISDETVIRDLTNTEKEVTSQMGICKSGIMKEYKEVK